MPQTNAELLKATKALADEVHTLSGRLSAKEILARRTRLLSIIGTFIALVSLVGLGISAYTIKTNADNAKIGCENANETRAAQRAIWEFVYEANSDPRPEESAATYAQRRKVTAELRAYTDQVFAQRDCDNLSRKYELPDPPRLPE